MKEFLTYRNRDFLAKRIGDISQIAGIKQYELLNGKSRGVMGLDFKTGGGFNFTVLPGRGMDIAWADYKGLPISYISKTGVVSPSYYESNKTDWLRGFFAGLLTTCGLCNVGEPCKDIDPRLGEREYGLHGRISNTPAENLCIRQKWEGDKFVMEASGTMRDAIFKGENMVLERKISTSLGAKSFKIIDVIENQGFSNQPLMLLYHINIGYPLLDEESKLVINSKDITPGDDFSKRNIDDFDTFGQPLNNCPDNVYFHETQAAEDGTCLVGLVNYKHNNGVYIKYNKSDLPKFIEWKVMSETEYVLGLEPATCLPIGRKQELEYLKPGESKRIELEIGILTNKTEIEEFVNVVENTSFVSCRNSRQEPPILIKTLETISNTVKNEKMEINI